jgi:hypothetical protein
VRFTAATFKRRIEQLLSDSPRGSQLGEADSTGGLVDLAPLLDIRDDEEFLREAYRRVLGVCRRENCEARAGAAG